jgi:chromosome segregation ATPase
MRTEFLANRKKLQQALGEVDELGKTLAEQERLAREREAKALNIQAAAHASVVENWKRALETQEASSTKQIDELKASLQDAEKGRKQAVADKEAAKKEFNELSRQLKEKSHMEAREANARINELETSRDRDQAQLAQLTMQLDEEDRARRKLESRTQAKLEKMRKAVDLDTPGAAVRARTMLYAEMNLQAPPGSAVRSPRATSAP